ncbi:hypothetical protein JTE90_023871 [Oedothorax gibbosus]|uniref:Uncharacterized protein n=1 Tax=Oedothorax gibbosus TaxID=931172 RepID=A0AAV6UNR9_9ARAC|nr:hypothetical protein JTE90_023871 [Oedothorax gibbosus]
MSFLGKGKKQDLLVVCEELGEKVDHLSKVPEIKKVIVGSESYDQIEVKVMLDRIIEERLRNEENEKQEAREKRKLELESEESKRKIELEREESLRKLELEREESLKKLETVTHDSTDFTPAELVHGRNLETPVMLLYGKLSEEDQEEDCVVNYVFELMNRMEKCQELAIRNMEHAKEKQKLWYDKKSVERQLKPGDLVLVVASSKPTKLSVHWIGPGETEDEEEIPVLECVDKSKGSKLRELLEETRLKSKLSEAQQNQLEKLLNHYSELFSNEPGCTDLAKHDIELEEDKPIIAKPYRMSPCQTEILKAEIWDTAGQERFRSVTHAYYRDAHALLLLYDVTNKASFDNTRAWLGEINEYAQDDVVIMLIGNKADATTDRLVQYQDGERLAKEYGVTFMETSAKTGTNVELAFMAVARELKYRQTCQTDKETKFNVKEYVRQESTKSSSSAGCCG